MIVQYQITSLSRHERGNAVEKEFDRFDVRFISNGVLELFTRPMATDGTHDRDATTPILPQTQGEWTISGRPNLRELLPAMSGGLVEKRDHFAIFQ
jgi:hypothetical protein